MKTPLKHILKDAEKLSVALATLALVNGCATSGTPSAKIDAPPTVSAKIQQKAKGYKISVHSVTEAEVAPGQCYKHVVKVKALWDWKEAVSTANFCLRAKDYPHV